MKMIAKKMIQFNRKLYNAGESFEICDSQGLLMIKNGFAEEDHSQVVEEVKEEVEPVEVAKEQPEPKKSKKAKK